MVIDEPGGGIIPSEEESEGVLLATINYSETAQASNSITDLTGYTWVATSDDPLNISTASYSMNFTSNNQNFTSLVLTRQTTILRYMSYDNLQVYESGIWTNEAYKTIQITGGTDATNSTLIAWLEANGTLTAPIQANTYNLTHTLTNLTKGNITLQITPDTGYTYPTTLTVTNGTLVSYDNTTGIAVINGDDTTIVSGECVAQASGYEVSLKNGYDWMTSSYTGIKIKVNGMPTNENDFDYQVGYYSGSDNYVNTLPSTPIQVSSLYVWANQLGSSNLPAYSWRGGGIYPNHQQITGVGYINAQEIDFSLTIDGLTFNGEVYFDYGYED